MAKQQEPKATLTMKVNSARYGSCCPHCSQRIRVGRRFVVNPENSDETFHVQCFMQKQRKR